MRYFSFAFFPPTFHLVLMEDWNIQPRGEACSRCEAAFADKQPYQTVLSVAAEGYLRQDLCVDCWQAAGGTTMREKAGVVSCWRGVYELPAQVEDPLPREDAESILRRMIQHNDPAELEARYILAVMLERKRVLKHRETQGERQEILVYEHPKTGEVFLITDPRLRLDQLEDVQRRVTAMLKGGSEHATGTANAG